MSDRNENNDELILGVGSETDPNTNEVSLSSTLSIFLYCDDLWVSLCCVIANYKDAASLTPQ